MPGFSEADLSVGDWIKYRDVGGLERIAEIRSFYPFGREGESLADTSLGRVPLSLILEVRRHLCDRSGKPTSVVDESGDEPITRIAATCSRCGKPQVFGATAARSAGSKTG